MTQTAEKKGGELVTLVASRLPYHPNVHREFNIDPQGWKALTEAVWPLAQEPGSIVMALSYCKARKLDPFKRVVHIVPVWSKEAGRLVDTVWPGVAELRTTAFRTGLYAGRDETKFGPDITERVGKTEMTFPEWAQVTVYRLIGGQRVAFPGPRVYWRETYAQAKREDISPNSMWQKRPRGQIEKCAEAAALRAAFPEELGGEMTADEMHGQVIEGTYDEKGQTWTPNAMAERPRRDDAPRLAFTYADTTGEIVETEPMTADGWCSMFREMWDASTLEGREALKELNRETAQEWAARGADAPMVLWNESANALDIDREAAAIADTVVESEVLQLQDGGTIKDAEVIEVADTVQAAPEPETLARPEVVRVMVPQGIDRDELLAIVKAMLDALAAAPDQAWVKEWRKANSEGIDRLPAAGKKRVGQAIEEALLRTA